MSSSLDDLEPYEIFQHELDEYLKDYHKTLSLNWGHEISNNHLFYINTFIEYICFLKSKSSLNELMTEEITTEFMDFVAGKFGNEIDNKEVKIALYEFLNFIYKLKGQPHQDALNSLKF